VTNLDHRLSFLAIASFGTPGHKQVHAQFKVPHTYSEARPVRLVKAVGPVDLRASFPLDRMPDDKPYLQSGHEATGEQSGQSGQIG
jgi:hypothetical protein